MKQLITFLAIAVLAVACEKSAVTNENEMKVGAATQKVTGIFGTWKLVSYWQDIGNGTGTWITPDFTETITFTESGEFSSSPSFPLYSRGYTKYIAKETIINFYPATSTNNADDTFTYSLQGSTLTFYPRCRETCTRIYQLVN
jgi:hypothetical protein